MAKSENLDVIFLRKQASGRYQIESRKSKTPLDSIFTEGKAEFNAAVDTAIDNERGGPLVFYDKEQSRALTVKINDDVVQRPSKWAHHVYTMRTLRELVAGMSNTGSLKLLLITAIAAGAVGILVGHFY